MAQATIELRNLMKTNFKLFDFPYSFDDPTFKKQIEENIIDFFYDYEIGFETPDMFKRKFKARWLRIMPYYNQLYNTTLLSYNPLTNYSVSEALDQLSKTSSTQTNNTATDTTGKTITNGTTSTEENSTGKTTNNSNTKNSDYPQQAIGVGDFLNGESTSKVDGTTTNQSTGTASNNNTSTSTGSGTTSGNTMSSGTTDTGYTKTIEGITGTSYPDLIQKHREVLMRINDLIIEEMKPCFILVY